jgi:putative serine protease PepD
LFAAVLAASLVGGTAGSVATAIALGRGGVGASVPVVSAAASAAVANTVLPDNTLKSVYRQVSPSVVSVETAMAAQARGTQRVPGFPNTPRSQATPGPNAPGGQGQGQGQGGPDLMPRGEGTGFIVDASHIVTNYHVVEGADRVTIILADGTSVQATVVGSDPGSDLAVLQATLPANKTAAATLGDSDAIEPGDTAIAIGSPFGFDHTLTAGIISAVDRDFGTAAGRPMRGLLQTDAPINPGNSGGPLFNAAGEVIGVTTSIESPVRGNVGIGFAIPINRVKQLLPQLLAGQQVQHPWLGISGSSIADAQALGRTVPNGVSQGVVVAQVSPGSPAANAGLRSGDVIVAVDGKTLQNVEDISDYLDSKRPGDTVTLTINRDGNRQDVHATLAAWPDSPNLQ